MYKNIIVVTSIVVFSILIALSFWKYDLQYSQPTPLPENYQKVEFGSRPMGDSTFFPENKAVLLHFFNPDCPCSRFHIASFKSLVNSNKDSVNIYTILQVEANQVSEEFKKYDLNIPVLINQSGSLAKAYGVYSTPQVVILDKTGKIFYRGNYNITRYCNNKQTSFADIALSSVLRGDSLPYLPVEAVEAYGCQLPSNYKSSIYQSIFSNSF